MGLHCIVTCISFHYIYQGLVQGCKDRGGRKALLQHIEGFQKSGSPLPGFIFASHGCDRYTYFRKSFNEPSVEVCIPQELQDLFNLS